MLTLLVLSTLVASASAKGADYGSLLTDAKGALLAGDYREARDLLTAAEQAAPLAEAPISQQSVARLFFYRGVLFWRASPESAALDAWRQALAIAPDFQPEPELLGEPSEREVFLALGKDVKAKAPVEVAVPVAPGQAVVYIDGRTLAPTDTIPAGDHLVQVRCENGQLEGSWHTFGDPPKNYLVLCSGGTYGGGSSNGGSSSASKSPASKPESASKRADKAPKAKADSSGGETAKNVAGIALIGLGVGGGVGSLLLYDQASMSAEAYDRKTAATSDDPTLLESTNNYYDDVVVPRYLRFYGATIGSGALLAGGVLLVILDVDGPMVAPIRGGGVLTWSGRF